MKDCAHVPELGGRQLPAAAKARPTIEELREYLDYDPESGVLRWKRAINSRARAGNIAGSVCCPSAGRKYWSVRFRGRLFYAHRVAFALHHGRWPHPCCDHIDGNSLNNRAGNLRECSVSENGRNAKTPSHNKTGIKGVYRRADGYLASVKINGVARRKYFGRLEDAAAYAKQLREQLHGEFARHE